MSNVPKAETKGSLTWQDFATLFSSLDSKDKESWCVETDEGTKKRSLTPDSFLAPKRTRHRAYCSFLVQKDVAAYEKTESALPVVKLPNVDWSYESALWIFSAAILLAVTTFQDDRTTQTLFQPMELGIFNYLVPRSGLFDPRMSFFSIWRLRWTRPNSRAGVYRRASRSRVDRAMFW